MIPDINKYSEFNFDHSLNTAKSNTLVSNSIAFSFREDNLVYSLHTNEFNFELQNNRFDDNKENIIIVLSKDNGIILEYTIKKLCEFGIDKQYDILLVDDRSITSEIYDISNRYNLSYLKIDNTHNVFNYSILNNIASLFAIKFNKTRCIFYNNDLWPGENTTLNNILSKHKTLSSGITGCRLVYPSEEEYNHLNKPQHILSSKLKLAYNTIQHGGIYFYPHKNILYPYHLWRFYPANHAMACQDTKCFAVTGALQIVDTELFVSLGGFNPILQTSFQDIDLCLRLVSRNLGCITYLGSEHMVHAESLTHFKDGIHNTNQALSDKICWNIIWQRTIFNLIGYSYSSQ
jgi:hypothetical protein